VTLAEWIGRAIDDLLSSAIAADTSIGSALRCQTRTLDGAKIFRLVSIIRPKPMIYAPG
jgi:hypothetical protein